MEQPNQPRVKPSEPEQERQKKNSLSDFMTNLMDERGKILSLNTIRDNLQSVNLDVDSDGFLIDTETGEYATPYCFVEELVEEYVREDDETIFEAFFRPVTHEKVFTGNKKIHLSELHSVIPPQDEETSGHPVSYDWFKFGKLYANLETGFSVITEWSDMVEKEEFNTSDWVFIRLESDESLSLNCLNPSCLYSGDHSEWDSEEIEGITCPECGGDWKQDITVCTICNTWHWGTHFVGESIHSEPSCPQCGTQEHNYLYNYTRHTEHNSFEEAVTNESPDYKLIGVSESGQHVKTLEYFDTFDEAKEQKDRTGDIPPRVYDEISEVKIVGHVTTMPLTQYTDDDLQVV